MAMMNPSSLQIDTVENGFVAFHGNVNSGCLGKTWVFETAEALSEFVGKWGQENTKATQAENTAN